MYRKIKKGLKLKMAKILLTGDRPTGELHLGHYIGSLKNRIAFQDEYSCFILLADLHTLTTKIQKEDINKIDKNIMDIVLTYLSCGIDPKKSTIYLQSQINEVYHLNLLFQNLVTVQRLNRIPSIKDMANNSNLTEIPLALLAYPVLQSADILLFNADLVPVGKDNKAHIELTQEIAKRFNNYYGEYFTIPQAIIPDMDTLIGTDGKNKMSKSLNNSISLNEDSTSLKKKVFSMFTDPNRIKADTPGKVEGNPVFIYHDLFNKNISQIEDMKSRYKEGKIRDVEVKQALYEALDDFLNPIREKRKELEQNKSYIASIIIEGTLKMQKIAEQNLKVIKDNMGLTRIWKKINKKAKDHYKNK